MVAKNCMVVNYKDLGDLEFACKMLLNIEVGSRVFDHNGEFVNSGPEYIEYDTVNMHVRWTECYIMCLANKPPTQRQIDMTLAKLYETYNIQYNMTTNVNDGFCVTQYIGSGHRPPRSFDYGNGVMKWNIEQRYDGVSPCVVLRPLSGISVKPLVTIYAALDIIKCANLRCNVVDDSPLYVNLGIADYNSGEIPIPVFDSGRVMPPNTLCDNCGIFICERFYIISGDRVVCKPCLLNYISNNRLPNILYGGNAASVDAQLGKMFTGVTLSKIIKMKNKKCKVAIYNKLIKCIQVALAQEHELVIHTG